MKKKFITLIFYTEFLYWISFIITYYLCFVGFYGLEGVRSLEGLCGDTGPTVTGPLRDLICLIPIKENQRQGLIFLPWIPQIHGVTALRPYYYY